MGPIMQRKTPRWSLIAVCLGRYLPLAMACFAASANATILNVQFLGHAGDQKGVADPRPPVHREAGAIGADGDYWNGVPAEAYNQPLAINTPPTLLAADGKTSLGVRMSFESFYSADHWPPTQGAPVTNALMNSYLVCNARAGMTIEGLIPGAAYDLYLFGNNSRHGVGSKFSVNNSAPRSTQGSQGAAFTEGTDYAIFTGVKADENGELDIAVEPGSGDLGIFNGFQLQGDLPRQSETELSSNCAHQSLADLRRTIDRRASFVAEPVVSFTYGGKPSLRLLAGWKSGHKKRKLDADRTEYVSTWTDPKTGLQMRVVGIEYHDFPAVEWTAWFKNTGRQNTPVLRNIQAIDVLFERSNTGEFVLNGIKGDFCTADSYEPYQLTLVSNFTRVFAPPPFSGKSCDGPDGWPYFNLQTPGGGVMMAVGWPGQWASSFTRDAGSGLRVKAGQQLTRFYLKPGEEVRTPLIALLFWTGSDVVDAQNLWRRWYRAHTLPRTDGKPQGSVLQIQVMGGNSDIAYVNSFLEAGIRPDLCWRDAVGPDNVSWYPSDTGPYKGDTIFLNTGTWEIDARQYPKGFRPFADWIHGRGIQFALWFEPERVGDPNSWLSKQHPEWLLPGTTHGALLNEGNPAARKWLTDHIDGMIKAQGLDWYREDMNGGGPLPAWRRNDVPDRLGITENHYVQGHLAFWDELKLRNPKLRIDSCASGGRRNDLETMRRAVPLLRSDFQWPGMEGVVEGNQGHTYGLSNWLPFQGQGVYADDPYSFRSFYAACFGMGKLTKENAAVQKQAYAECRQIAPFMLFGDYHPLTPYSRQFNQWIAWQFDRPEEGKGVIQAFRRKDCAETALSFKLRGLEANATYQVVDLDQGSRKEVPGGDLMNKGLIVEIQKRPGSAILLYEKRR